MKHQSYVAGSKGAHLLEFLYDIALSRGLRITIDRHNKSIFSETILYTLEGTLEQVRACDQTITATIKHHNSGKGERP